MKRSSSLILAVMATLVISGCGKVTSTHLVSGYSTQQGTLKPSLQPTHGSQPSGTAATPVKGVKGRFPEVSAPSITASITVNKTKILNTEYFYGDDLQYSTIYDKSSDLYNQSQANGHIPVKFRQNGQELQLIEDTRRLFPSDVNHPERIVSRFKILSETADSFTLSEANSADYVSTTIDDKAGVPRDHWARSFEYVKEGDYLLQESSVVMNDGTQVEVMESVFPRANLEASASFRKIQMDPEDPTGGDDAIFSCYRFLDGEAIKKGETKLAFAQHFDIANGATIDWYATDNISDEHMEVAKEAVEGWNRYFKTYAGINREVVKFKGRLPIGVKIGDPRYNVINWDSRLVAGAAYESQASDPFTGKQSHSLIYMPVAWFQIGMDYWKNGGYSDIVPAPTTDISAPTPGPVTAGNPAASATPVNASTAPAAPGSKLDIESIVAQFQPSAELASGKLHASKGMASAFRHRACERDMQSVGAILNSNRMSDADAKIFSIELMKQTLFHEVGHALGLAHNFKGSLSFDREDPKSLFSASIMDYNDYEVERPAFSDVHSSDGPLLEYDRQILSQIYNNGKDVKDADPTLPVCTDAEADTATLAGVDPLCMRYDIEKDPTLSTVTALKRITEATLPNDVTLVQALQNVNESLVSVDAAKALDTEATYLEYVSKVQSTLIGVLNFYVNAGTESLAKTVTANTKSMDMFETDILPKTYDEKAMRDRAFTAVNGALAMSKLPDLVTAQIKTIAINVMKTLINAPFIQSAASQDDAEKLLVLTAKQIMLVGPSFEASSSKGLVKLKISVLTKLLRNKSLPFFLGKAGDSQYDFETNIVSLVYGIVMDKTRSPSERLASSMVLASYKGRGTTDSLISKAKEEATLELATASTNMSRELFQTIVGVLN